MRGAARAVGAVGIWGRLVVLLGVFLLLATARQAEAHASSDAYLTLSLPSVPADGGAVRGRWDVPLLDLDGTLGLDHDHDGAISAGEVRRRRQDIAALAFSKLTLHADGTECPLTLKDLAFADHQDAVYVGLVFTAACPAPPQVLDVDYSLFFEGAATGHVPRALVRVEDGPVALSVIFTSGSRHERFTRSTPDRTKELLSALRSGVAHIATGADHLLFLLVLLLPSVLRREGGAWEPLPSLRAAVVQVAKVVTAFTVAHSLTLALAVLGVIRLSPRFIEPAIAASVVYAALENVLGSSPRGRWRVAFALGLLHGFGFSAAIVDLGLGRGDLALTLLGFNVGVEVGQLVIVAVFLPLAFPARRSRFYRTICISGGSAIIALVATVWVIQRLVAS